MEYKRLGRSNLNISEISLGCWAMGGDYWGEADDDESIRVIRTALEDGVNFIDTAYIYGMGRSEEVVGKALKGYPRDKVYISTKLWKTDMKRQDVKKACEASLKRLQVEYADVYFIHWPVEHVPLEETMAAMLELKQEGKIRLIGLSNFSVEQMKKSFEIGRFEVLQTCFNLFWRYAQKEEIPYCIDNGIGVVVYSPLAQGLLTGKFKNGAGFGEGDKRPGIPLFQPGLFSKCVNAAEALGPIAGKYGKTQGQLAINWTNSQQGIISSIVGARNVGQLKENLGAPGWRVGNTDMNLIDVIGRGVTDEMPEYINFFNKQIRSN